jgi:hypothetical protein
MWVLQNCGVHKPTIRAIEMVLRQPGLSFGKVMILCGGPDWPTSVLCGLLGLSLISCEIGTLPIIFYIAPFSYSGSFLLRRNEAEIWKNASNLMLYITVLMTLVYWAACAWVIQHTFTEQHDAITRRLKKNIDLDWLDHKKELIDEKTKVTLGEAPPLIRCAYIGGAVMMIVTFYAFWLCYYSMFATFKMTENNPDDINWFDGNDGLIKPLALVVFGALFFGFGGLAVFNMWAKSKTREARIQATRDADAMEASWKEREQKEREQIEATAALYSPGQPQGLPEAADQQHPMAPDNAGATPAVFGKRAVGVSTKSQLDTE